VISGLGVIAITGLLITVTTAGTIFGVHLLNRIDDLQVFISYRIILIVNTHIST